MTTDDVLAPPLAPETSLRAMFEVRGYGFLCASSFLWHTTRWGGLFTTSYLLTTMSGSPMVIQIAGALLFAPMLLGGFLAGAISDRFERKRLLLCIQSLLVPVEFLMFWLVQSGQVQVWMAFPFMFLIGIGGLANMTAQRPLIYETVGPRFAGRAMTIESTAQAGSAMIGTLVGGTLIDRVGLGAGFCGMGVLLCVSLGLLWMVPQPQHAVVRSGTVPMSIGDQLRAGRRLVRDSRRLRAMLLVTVVMNLCMFGYLPLVPSVAAHLAGGAALAGLLAAGPGFGQIVGGLALTSRQPGRHFLVFAGGSGLALVGLGGFAAAPVFVIALAALFVSGLGQSAFGSMQSLLAIESARGAERGVALGVLSTCIGVLPIGTVVLGLLAELLGTRPAVAASAILGLSGLAVLMIAFADVLRDDPVQDDPVQDDPA